MAISADRLAETEYVYFVDPEHTIETQFGLFQNHPQYQHRIDAHQLAKCHCPRGHATELLSTLEELYAPSGLDYQYIMGHDEGTYHYLAPILESHGWQLGRIWMFTFDGLVTRTSNPEIEIRRFDALTANGTEIPNIYQHVKGRHQEDLAFYCSNDDRVGGEWIIAYLDGEPISATGWYLHDNLARYRPVATIPSAERLGAATTLMRYIQSHPTVQAQEKLVLLCREDGPVPLYEQLGFVKQAWMWEALLERPL